MKKNICLQSRLRDCEAEEENLMKKILLIFMAAAMLDGCATQRKVSILKCRVDALEAASIRKDHQAENTQLIMTHRISNLEGGAPVSNNQLRDRDDRIKVLEEEVAYLKAFKADHDKRWPPPVKLKTKGSKPK
jgi:hypothetical protein